MMLISFSLAADYTLRINSLLVPFAAFFRGTDIGMQVLRVLRHSAGVEGDGHCRLSASGAKGLNKGSRDPDNRCHRHIFGATCHRALRATGHCLWLPGPVWSSSYG